MLPVDSYTLYRNDDGEFSNSFKGIYPWELERKLEHSGRYATFLDLDIKIENAIFCYIQTIW